jgi:hypothetical protein
MTANPNPVPNPFGLVVKKGSKIFSMWLGSIPVPVSRTGNFDKGAFAVIVILGDHGIHRDENGPPLGHGIPSVHHKVQHHPFELSARDEDRASPRE